MKKTLVIPTIIICTLSFPNLSAQESTIQYDLSQYKLPYLKRHVLEFDFDFNGITQSSTDEYTSVNSNNTSSSEDKSYTLQSRISPSYSFYLNDEKLQISQSGGANIPSLNFARSEVINADYYPNTPYSRTINKSSFFPISMNYGGEFREFIRGKYFLEQDVDLNLTYQKGHQFYQNQDSINFITQDRTSDSKRKAANIEFNLVGGWGRIEQVQDARLAVYILDDLNKAGKLNKAVTHEEIQTLSGAISHIQNERFFDSRKKQIWELQQIDSVLKDLGLISQEDIAYYAMLKDNWDYANGPVRKSGFQVSGGLYSSLNYEDILQEQSENFFDLDSLALDTYKRRNGTSALGGGLGIKYENPLNLYWQVSILNETVITKSKEIAKFNSSINALSVELETPVNNFTNQLSVSLSYYPNSRTSLSFYCQNYIEYTHYTDENSYAEKNLDIDNTLGTLIAYYLSPQLRLQFSASLNNSYTTYTARNEAKEHQNNLQGMFSGRLTYKIM